MPVSEESYDVAIVGGGPAGSTAATLLKKYAPELRVLVLEKEVFPRDHIGESMLLPISLILDEMEVWDAVEAADFPIKIGASYTWGRNSDRWDINFYPIEKWRPQPRPAKFEGQRRSTAFQVERCRYDKILLDHAESRGAEVRQGTRVDEVLVRGDRIEGLKLSDRETATAQYYIDGSGTMALFRRALGIGIDPNLELRNIAIWDYWRGADWAVEVEGGATRIQVRSLPYGWIWFIPIGSNRTSVGVVCPAEYYKEAGLNAEELYQKSLQRQPEVWKLLRPAKAEGRITTCRDWSHLADRVMGENWFLCGEAAGFADPILSAGMTLAHESGRDAAYTILELRRGEHEPAWLRQRYEERQRGTIRQHIQFAQYWYATNSCFTDLKEHCAGIASDAGLHLAPDDAWDWLGRGGFATESNTIAMAGTFDPGSAKKLIELFTREKRRASWLIDGHNVFQLDLRGAKTERVGVLRQGRIQAVPCYVRNGRRLPCAGNFAIMIEVLRQTSALAHMAALIEKAVSRISPHDKENADSIHAGLLQVLEVLVSDGWVERKIDTNYPTLRVPDMEHIRLSRETDEVVRRAGRSSVVRSRIDEPDHEPKS
ncbi:MAG TPA: NAD(P)/FAD-dependent oxidoreductase [Chthoniobacterales bacterium]